MSELFVVVLAVAGLVLMLDDHQRLRAAILYYRIGVDLWATTIQVNEYGYKQ
jgi:hypothetical protein